jgi:hypothetical protein
MDIAAVLAQLRDLPPTFQPNGNPFTQIQAALAQAEALMTSSADQTFAQVAQFDGAVDGWIDLWGLLFGLPRQDGEGNLPYATRIGETVLANVGSLAAIQVWINLFAPGGSVAVNQSGVGYTINLPPMTKTQAGFFLASLNNIRPAGVPFVVNIATGIAMFLGTETFLGAVQIEGAYLINSLATLFGSIGSTTPSAQPLIPTLFLSDPALNAGVLS